MLSISPLAGRSAHPYVLRQQDDLQGTTDRDITEEVLYQNLQGALKEIGLPRTREWMQCDPAPGACYSDLCICVLGSPLPYLSLLLEAGQISPGDSLLCLSSSWLSRSSSSSLMVHRAVAFDLGGRTTLMSFSPPRRVTYFLSCDPFGGEEVTRGVGCPIGGSRELSQFWGNILTARVQLQKAKINCPATLAFLLPPKQRGVKEGCTGQVEVVLLETGAQRATDFVRNKTYTFLESNALKQTDKVVLKCCGGRYVSGGGGPLYLPWADREQVWARVSQLLPALLPGEAVLLEAFCPPLMSGPQAEDRTWEQYTDHQLQVPDLSFRLCAIVTRSPQNVPLLYKYCQR